VPLTFPSHAAAVLPLKMWRRRWFDGVALVIGSAAPDVPYALDPYLHIRAHTWWGLVWFCVPVTLLLAVLTRRAAPAVVAHLRSHRWLRDYAALSARRHRWWVSVVSACLGALSHRLWDMVTHASIDRGTVRIAWLSTEVAGQPWWRVLHYGSTVVGAAAVVVLVVHIGRTEWLLADGRVARLPAPRPVWFWGAAAVVWVPALAIQPLLAWHDQPQTIIVRLLAVGCLGLLAGAAATSLAARRGAAGRGHAGRGAVRR
jgi:hypothetical protein